VVHTTVVGSYPRVSDAPEGQRLRRAIARWERHELTDSALRDVQMDVLREVVKEQARFVDLPADGQVTWYDPVSHFAAKLEGFEIGGLLRYFDTNTYYRQPRPKGKVRWTGAITVDDWMAASAASPAPVKAVVTGPYTLAVLSAGAASHVPDLAWELAVALGHELGNLVHAGATHLQVDEPALAGAKALPKGYDEIAKVLLEGQGRARSSLFIYFGGVGHLLPELLDLPFDVLGLDFVQGAGTLAALRTMQTEKQIAFGLVDARNTRLEDPKVIAKAVLGFEGRVPLEDSYLCPSNGLEYLPRSRAREKLKVLVYAAKIVREVGE